MKKGLLFVLSFTALLASCDFKYYMTKGKPYNNDKYGFRLKYPQKWEINDTGFMGSAVVLIASQWQGDFKPSVNVFVRESQSLPLIEYVKKSKEGLDNEVVEVGYKLKKFVSEGKTKLGKYEGYQLTYLFSQYGTDLKARSLYYVLDERAFILTFTAKETDFEKAEGDFAVISETFRIK